MNNLKKMHYPTEGSLALEMMTLEEQGCSMDDSDIEKKPISGVLSAWWESMLCKVMETECVYEFLNGNIRGKAVGRAKPWQSLLMGAGLFSVALAFIYIGT